mmetsp:Transcript_57809/g.136214  ORF Transcript_57809/g.136214 Transcript_57809/m.136214 type:complete len:274 (-) Transcript_57809:307-1128(-)
MRCVTVAAATRPRCCPPPLSALSGTGCGLRHVTTARRRLTLRRIVLIHLLLCQVKMTVASRLQVRFPRRTMTLLRQREIARRSDVFLSLRSCSVVLWTLVWRRFRTRILLLFRFRLCLSKWSEGTLLHLLVDFLTSLLSHPFLSLLLHLFASLCDASRGFIGGSSPTCSMGSQNTRAEGTLLLLVSLLSIHLLLPPRLTPRLILEQAVDAVSGATRPRQTLINFLRRCVDGGSEAEVFCREILDTARQTLSPWLHVARSTSRLRAAPLLPVFQ